MKGRGPFPINPNNTHKLYLSTSIAQKIVLTRNEVDKALKTSKEEQTRPGRKNLYIYDSTPTLLYCVRALKLTRQSVFKTPKQFFANAKGLEDHQEGSANLETCGE